MIIMFLLRLLKFPSLHTIVVVVVVVLIPNIYISILSASVVIIMMVVSSVNDAPAVDDGEEFLCAVNVGHSLD